MDLKEYFEKLRIIDIEIAAKEHHIKELGHILDALLSTVKNAYQSDLKRRHITEVKEIISDFEYKFIEYIKLKLDTKRELLDIINKAKNPEYRVILELRYVNQKTWEEIAEIMNYSVRNMHYIHKKALKHLSDAMADAGIKKGEGTK